MQTQFSPAHVDPCGYEQHLTKPRFISLSDSEAVRSHGSKHYSIGSPAHKTVPVLTQEQRISPSEAPV